MVLSRSVQATTQENTRRLLNESDYRDASVSQRLKEEVMYQSKVRRHFVRWKLETK